MGRALDADTQPLFSFLLFMLRLGHVWGGQLGAWKVRALRKLQAHGV